MHRTYRLLPTCFDSTKKQTAPKQHHEPPNPDMEVLHCYANKNFMDAMQVIRNISSAMPLCNQTWFKLQKYPTVGSLKCLWLIKSNANFLCAFGCTKTTDWNHFVVGRTFKQTPKLRQQLATTDPSNNASACTLITAMEWNKCMPESGITFSSESFGGPSGSVYANICKYWCLTRLSMFMKRWSSS